MVVWLPMNVTMDIFNGDAYAICCYIFLAFPLHSHSLYLAAYIFALKQFFSGARLRCQLTYRVAAAAAAALLLLL